MLTQPANLGASTNLPVKNLFFIVSPHSCSTREFGRKHKFACEKFIFHSIPICLKVNFP